MGLDGEVRFPTRLTMAPVERSAPARAHELGTTRDWGAIYYERDGRERQNAVVTQNSGPLAGERAAVLGWPSGSFAAG
jgi:hypothetical protein